MKLQHSRSAPPPPNVDSATTSVTAAEEREGRIIVTPNGAYFKNKNLVPYFNKANDSLRIDDVISKIHFFSVVRKKDTETVRPSHRDSFVSSSSSVTSPFYPNPYFSDQLFTGEKELVGEIMTEPEEKGKRQ